LDRGVLAINAQDRRGGRDGAPESIALGIDDVQEMTVDWMDGNTPIQSIGLDLVKRERFIPQDGLKVLRDIDQFAIDLREHEPLERGSAG
jgi:hypothetical protein